MDVPEDPASLKTPSLKTLKTEGSEDSIKYQICTRNLRIQRNRDRCLKFCHHDRGSARTLLSQVFGTPQGAMRELGMISDNIDKAPQQGIAHLPAAYLYPITTVAFHGIV